MTDLLAVLAVCAVAVYAVREGAAVARQWVAAKYPAPETAVGAIAVPEDIVAKAMAESEEWAQEEVLKVARERFASIKDATMPDAQKWNLVRRAIGIGARDG